MMNHRHMLLAHSAIVPPDVVGLSKFDNLSLVAQYSKLRTKRSRQKNLIPC